MSVQEIVIKKILMNTRFFIKNITGINFDNKTSISLYGRLNVYVFSLQLDPAVGI